MGPQTLRIKILLFYLRLVNSLSRMSKASPHQFQASRQHVKALGGILPLREYVSCHLVILVMRELRLVNCQGLKSGHCMDT